LTKQGKGEVAAVAAPTPERQAGGQAVVQQTVGSCDCSGLPQHVLAPHFNAHHGPAQGRILKRDVVPGMKEASWRSMWWVKWLDAL